MSTRPSSRPDVLTGRSTRLRAIAREDLPQLLAWRNDPDLRRHFREYRELTTESQDRWFNEIVIADSRTEMFAIEDADGRLIGCGGLCYIDWVNGTADLSIYVGIDGLYIDGVLAPDAAMLLLTFAFETLDLARIWTEIYEYDGRKRAMLEGLGFLLEGVHREHHVEDGKRHDSLFFGLLRREFQSASS